MLSQVYGWFSKAATGTQDQEQKGLAAGSATAMSPPQSITAYNDTSYTEGRTSSEREPPGWTSQTLLPFTPKGQHLQHFHKDVQLTSKRYGCSCGASYPCILPVRVFKQS